MKQLIIRLTLFVVDYKEAMDFFTKKLDFTIAENVCEGNGKYYVVVYPPGAERCGIVLTKAKNSAQTALIGKQSPDEIFFHISTDDIYGDYDRMKQRGVNIIGGVTTKKYGKTIEFEDLYGNKLGLTQLNPKT